MNPLIGTIRIAVIHLTDEGRQWSSETALQHLTLLNYSVSRARKYLSEDDELSSFVDDLEQIASDLASNPVVVSKSDVVRKLKDLEKALHEVRR